MTLHGLKRGAAELREPLASRPRYAVRVRVLNVDDQEQPLHARQARFEDGVSRSSFVEVHIISVEVDLRGVPLLPGATQAITGA